MKLKLTLDFRIWKGVTRNSILGQISQCEQGVRSVVEVILYYEIHFTADNICCVNCQLYKNTCYAIKSSFHHQYQFIKQMTVVTVVPFLHCLGSVQCQEMCSHPSG